LRAFASATDNVVREKLTLTELFALFGHRPEETRAIGSADAEEYLALVTYLVERSRRR
jgi:hypothetical protein